MFHTDVRKVQKTGNSSYVITLPKEWIKAHGIKKNDPLALILLPDGSLVISPNTEGERVRRNKEFHVDGIDDPTYLFRLLIGAYILGYTIIVIKADERISPKLRDTVKKFIQTTIGPEIMEEDNRRIIIKDLLNPAEMPFDKTIMRMHILVSTMHEDAVGALRRLNKVLADDVVLRDGDVDRLHWLVARQSNMVIKDPELSRRMNVDTEDAIYYFLVSRIMERIGDHAVIIARSVRILIDQGVAGRVVDSISKASDMALKILRDSTDAGVRRDIMAAHRTVESVRELLLLCERIRKDALTVKGALSAAVSHIAESIRRTGEYAGDLSELLINRLIPEA